MNARQSNKLAAYSAVEALLKATPGIASVPDLSDKLTDLSTMVNEINRLATTQTKPIRASMVERDQILNTMADAAVEIAGLITTLARDARRPQLAEAVEVGRSHFRRGRRSHRLWFAQRVLDTARTVGPELARYGITDEKIDAFASQLEAARAAVNLPRHTAVNKKTATRRLADLFAEVDTLLVDKIDRLVFRLRKEDPTFDASYGEARSVIDRPGGRGRSAGTEPTPAIAEAATHDKAA